MSFAHFRYSRFDLQGKALLFVAATSRRNASLLPSAVCVGTSRKGSTALSSCRRKGGWTICLPNARTAESACADPLPRLASPAHVAIRVASMSCAARLSRHKPLHRSAISAHHTNPDLCPLGETTPRAAAAHSLSSARSSARLFLPLASFRRHGTCFLRSPSYLMSRFGRRII